MRTSVRVNIQGLEDRVYRGARAVDDAALAAVVLAVVGAAALWFLAFDKQKTATSSKSAG